MNSVFKINKSILSFISLLTFSIWIVTAQNFKLSRTEHLSNSIITGAERTDKYLHLLKGKRVAIMANPITIIGNRHLVDSLLLLDVNIVKVFGPEHGFRGNVSAGVQVNDETDELTGVPIISLYGKKKKPGNSDLADVDIVIYDLQDVGCRFYTNINALVQLMEACYETNKKLIILDRPNPNGYLVDGPVLDMKYESGIGMFPSPYVTWTNSRRIRYDGKWRRMVKKWCPV